jgi:hypothetical protein
MVVAECLRSHAVQPDLFRVLRLDHFFFDGRSSTSSTTCSRCGAAGVIELQTTVRGEPYRCSGAVERVSTIGPPPKPLKRSAARDRIDVG